MIDWMFWLWIVVSFVSGVAVMYMISIRAFRNLRAYYANLLYEMGAAATEREKGRASRIILGSAKVGREMEGIRKEGK
jgi:hypothetical protein